MNKDLVMDEDAKANSNNVTFPNLQNTVKNNVKSSKANKPMTRNTISPGFSAKQGLVSPYARNYINKNNLSVNSNEHYTINNGYVLHNRTRSMCHNNMTMINKTVDEGKIYLDYACLYLHYCLDAIDYDKIRQNLKIDHTKVNRYHQL